MMMVMMMMMMMVMMVSLLSNTYPKTLTSYIYKSVFEYVISASNILPHTILHKFHSFFIWELSTSPATIFIA